MTAILIAIFITSVISAVNIACMKKKLLAKLVDSEIDYESYFNLNDKYDLILGVSLLIMIISVIVIASF